MKLESHCQAIGSLKKPVLVFTPESDSSTLQMLNWHKLKQKVKVKVLKEYKSIREFISKDSQYENLIRKKIKSF